MKIGVMMFPTDLSIRPDELAREVESRGFESLFFPEHTHIPTSRKTPWPGGTELPEEYKRTYDPFVALAVAGAVTERIMLGTGICLVAQHDPIVLAKVIASLDALSGGRFLFGVGVGWNVDEMEHHGVDPKQRRAVVREKVLAMKELWTKEAGGYDGKFVSFSPSWSWPKPVQRPHPPILLGGVGSELVFRNVIEWADGWMPIEGRYDIVDRIEALRSQAETSGRDPSSIEICVFGSRGREDALERYAQAGVTRLILGLPPASRDTVLPVLDARAELLARV